MTQPLPECSLCPRLADFRRKNRQAYPQFFNAPVPSFGRMDAELLVVGLAPGLKGANATGRPFTGDYAGIILYNALLKHGFAKGIYNPSPTGRGWRVAPGEGAGSGDALTPTPLPGGEGTFALLNCRITNAVRCVPPENKPEPGEIKSCNGFLAAEIAAMPHLKTILSLGLISHNAVLKALGFKPSHAAFAHGAAHELGSLTLIDSYHCSRYNINTRRLTPEMFDGIMIEVKTRTSHESSPSSSCRPLQRHSRP